MDRRVYARLEVRLPCHVELPQTRSRLFVGLTENISRSGVLVQWTGGDPTGRLPQPGQLLSADIELPANHAFGRKCLHCQVTVVRVSRSPEGTARVAFQIGQMQFRSYATGRFTRVELEKALRQALM